MLFKKRYTCLYAVVGFGFAFCIESRLQAQLLFSQSYGNNIAEYDLITGASLGNFVSAGSGGLSVPREVLFGPDGNVYVSGTGVKRYNGATGAFIDTFIPVGSGGLSPQAWGMAFGPDGNLYLADRGTESVKRYDGTTGIFINTFIASGVGNLVRPYVIDFGKDGSLYINDVGNAISGDGVAGVKKFDGSTGAFLGYFVGNTSGGLNVPTDMQFGPDGNLYVTSELGGQILRYDGTTGAFVDVFASGHGLLEPVSARFGPDGNLYILNLATADATQLDAIRFNGNGQFESVFVQSVPQAQPNDVGLIAFFPRQTSSVPEPGIIAFLTGGLYGTWRIFNYRRNKIHIA